MNKLQEPQNKGSQAQEKPTFIMLAAGNSRRFGSNKLLYEIGGVPMYLRTLHKLQKAASELGNCEIIVVTQYEEIASKAQESGVRVLINSHPERGISSSMQIGLAAAKESAACLFIVSDQPGSPQRPSSIWCTNFNQNTKAWHAPSLKTKPETPASSPGNITRNYRRSPATKVENRS